MLPVGLWLTATPEGPMDCPIREGLAWTGKEALTQRKDSGMACKDGGAEKAEHSLVHQSCWPTTPTHKYK